MNIKILALPPNAEAEEEEAKRMEEKNARNAKKKDKGQRNKKDAVKKKKMVPKVDGTYTKNIVYKEVLTRYVRLYDINYSLCIL